MPIRSKIFEMMGRRDIRTRKELATLTGLAPWRIGILVKGDFKRLDLSTLAKLCKAFNCQPGDLLEYVPDPE